VFGSTTDTVVDEAAVPVIVVEANGSTALRGE
jgi:nucleotide-binding universal stress UspA family protein